MMIIFNSLKKQFILLGLVLALALLPYTAFAEVVEVSNKCIMSDKGWYEICKTELEFRDVPEISTYKTNIEDYTTIKTAFSMEKPVTKDLKFTSFTWDKDTLTVIGTIPVGTQNFWGILDVYNSSWWNSTFLNCMNVTIRNDVPYDLVNHFITLNFTNISDKRADNFDLRLINASCGWNTSVREIPYRIAWYNNSFASLVNLINLSANSNVTWALYYGNEYAEDPNYATDNYIYDDFIVALYDTDVWGQYEIGVIDSDGGDGDVYWYNVSISWENCPQQEFSSKYTFGATDTWCFEWKLGLFRTNIIGAENGWCWEGGGFHQVTGNTLYGFCEYANPFNFWVGYGDASNNIVPAGGIGTNTLVNDSATGNIVRMCHFNNQVNVITISNDTGVTFDYGWTNITQIAGITPKNLTVGNSLNTNCPFAENYSASIDYVKPSNSNITILFGSEETIAPPPPPDLTNVTVIDYLCIGNYSVKNTTLNSNSELIYTTCSNGCNENNLIITIFNNDPNLCNPNEWLSWLLFLAVVVIVLAILNRFLR